MGLFSSNEKAALRDRHDRDQISAIEPQSLRKLQATRDENGKHLYTRSQRNEYIRRAEDLERRSGQR